MSKPFVVQLAREILASCGPLVSKMTVTVKAWNRKDAENLALEKLPDNWKIVGLQET